MPYFSYRANIAGIFSEKEGDERRQYLRLICSNYEYLMRGLKDDNFRKSEMEDVTNALLKFPEESILAVLNYTSKFNKEQIDKLLKAGLLHTDGCEKIIKNYAILNNAFELPDNYRQDAIELVVFNDYRTRDCISRKNFSIEELKYIEKSFTNSSGKVESSIANSILRNYKDVNDYRINLFYNRIKERNANSCYSLCKDGYCNSTEKFIIHEKHGTELLKEIRRTYNAFYEYCETFQECLTEEEIELLIKKLSRKDKYKIEDAKSDFSDIGEDFQDALEALLMSKKLLGA